MTAIFALLILIFIGICKEDYSMIMSLGKIIGIGAGVVFFLYCFTQPILLIFVIVILIIIVIATTHPGRNNKIKNDKQNSQNSNSTYNLPIDNDVHDNELSDFQKELQQNTKTPQEIASETWIKEKEQIIKEANNDYRYIKQKLLSKAKSGQYTNINGRKCITTVNNSSYLLKCVDRQYSRNPTGRMGTSSYRTNDKVYYSVNKIKQYNFYLITIQKLASKDNIRIMPFFVEVDIALHKEKEINLPYTYMHEWKAIEHNIKAYLKCSIIY